jgi:hypothetical protein
MTELSRRQILVGAAAAASIAPAFTADRAHAEQAHMDASLDALKTARHELDAANPDKGGHRTRALGFVKDAIGEVEKGIEWAKHR